jgi:hypothetical protein
VSASETSAGAFDRHQRLAWELREAGNEFRIYDNATGKIISLP